MNILKKLLYIFTLFTSSIILSDVEVLTHFPCSCVNEDGTIAEYTGEQWDECDKQGKEYVDRDACKAGFEKWQAEAH